MLTDIAIRTAKPGLKPIKLLDEKGLYLLINPNGSKLWRCRYTYGSKENLLSLGAYPEITLKEARARRDEIRRQLAHGVDPSAVRKAAKTALAGADSFEALAREWYAKFSATWSSAYREKVTAHLDKVISYKEFTTSTGLIRISHLGKSGGSLVFAGAIKYNKTYQELV